MKELDIYNSHIAGYKHLFIKNWAGLSKLDDTVIIIDAVIRISDLLEKHKDSIREVIKFKLTALPLCEYTMEISGANLNGVMSSFNSMKNRILEPGFFKQLTFAHSLLTISGDSTEYKEKLFHDMKIIFDEHDEFYNNKDYYIKKYIGITDDDINSGKSIDMENGCFYHYVEVYNKTLHAIKYRFHQEKGLGIWDFGPTSVKMEQISNSTALVEYIEKFYPEHAV